ncbi:YczE/YyaS/YitT family protein [Lysinibacillus telephonicus]|uniref:YitT family protein n=1 Tax=Lysinibacillus telephonicus TaxID=1714840 RepID=A0A3S0QX57_9BACI|nr:YitT family protein [Lysinibacillus telephonicus]RTQ94910.1 YitT family protein [Lysinibacillus telephonicus]
MRRELKWKWLFFFGGIAIMSLGISMIIKGKVLGVSPWDVLHIGLFKQIGFSIGSWSIITGLVIVTGASIYLKQWPKVATWLNMILCGVFIDGFSWLLPNTDIFIFEVLYFIFGLVVMCLGCAMYISPNLGAGPRDTLMILIVEKFGGSIRRARFIMELSAVVLGWLLGGPVGIGTIIIVLSTGSIIQPALSFFRKLLEKQISEPEAEKLVSKHQSKTLAKES